MTSHDFDDDEQLCPLCMEEMDATDRNFKPCSCGYQVSYQFVVHFTISFPSTSISSRDSIFTVLSIHSTIMNKANS